MSRPRRAPALPRLEPGIGGRPPIIQVRGLHKVYGRGATAVHALRGVDLTVAAGEHVAIVGASGSGKSTLMHLLGCLDVPTAGRYLLDGVDVAALPEHELGIVRNAKIGFVFQAFNLVPRMSAVANVELPLVYRRVRAGERRERALEALEVVGLTDVAQHRPNELSGGQAQRVAIARALVGAPAMVLADEPTGNLDTVASQEVLAVFDALNAAGRTVVVITHEPDIAAHAARLVQVSDGLIVGDHPTARALAASSSPVAAASTGFGG